MMNDEVLEKLGQKIDSLINLLYAIDMKVSPEIHLQALKESLPDLTNELIEIHSEAGGENIWDDEIKLKKKINLMASNCIEYGLKFSQEEYEEIEDLAAIGYSCVKIALYFDVSAKDFKKEFNDPNSLIRHHYNVGLTKADAAIGLTLVANAKIGNITAIQQLEKVRKKTKVELIKQQIYFTNELE